jgi:surface carbohydrate biosynthesis protein
VPARSRLRTGETGERPGPGANRDTERSGAGRVCLVVDHPARDLEGAVRLAHELAGRGVAVVLTPMHELHEVLLLKPDLVVVNYVKLPYLPFLDTVRRLGTRIAVLDTEGGVVNVETFAANVSRHLDGVDLYCVWGQKQYEAMLAHQGARRVRLAVTGCPRYDFVTEPWRRALRPLRGIPDRFVLVNTNFPLINPRFQSPAREAREMVKVVHVLEDHVRERVRQTRIALDEMLGVVRHLARAFPSVPFVLRPHPFEDASLYQTALGELANVHVRQEGSVLEWINGAVAVVHHHCLTAVDAAMMDIEPLHVAWIPAPALELPVAAAASRHAASLGELTEAIRRLLDGDRLPESAALRERREDVVRDWFHRRDGRAAERVADALVDVLAGAGRERAAVIGKRSALATVLFHRGSARRSAQAVLLVGLGGGVYRRVRAALAGRQRPKGKSFHAADVQDTLNRLAAADPRPVAIRARPMSREDAYLRVRGPYASVHVSGSSSGSRPEVRGGAGTRSP